MTAITKNLPQFVKDLGVSIVGEKCYTSLVEDLNLADVDCLTHSVSKGLGIGLVFGGSIMKVPQVLLVVRARSARGLSFTAYVLETFAYAFTTAYSYGNQFPFSTYGENFFLAIQNVIIILLMIAYAPPRLSGKNNKAQRFITAVVSSIAGVGALYASPPGVLASLQLSTIPLSLLSKIPQIRQNSRSGSTGQMSAIAVVAQILGCLARVFTTLKEVNDGGLMLAGFVLALALNLVLGAQLWMYWGQDEIVKDEFGLGNTSRAVHEKKDEDARVQAYEPAWQQQQQQQQQGSSSPQRSGSPARFGTPPPGNRKWARKVD